jgi:hypothetical protein
MPRDAQRDHVCRARRARAQRPSGPAIRRTISESRGRQVKGAASDQDASSSALAANGVSGDDARSLRAERKMQIARLPFRCREDESRALPASEGVARERGRYCAPPSLASGLSWFTKSAARPTLTPPGHTCQRGTRHARAEPPRPTAKPSHTARHLPHPRSQGAGSTSRRMARNLTPPDSSGFFAERAGFEPAVGFPLRPLSKRVPSATRSPLRLDSERAGGWPQGGSRSRVLGASNRCLGANRHPRAAEGRREEAPAGSKRAPRALPLANITQFRRVGVGSGP